LNKVISFASLSMSLVPAVVYCV